MLISFIYTARAAVMLNLWLGLVAASLFSLDPMLVKVVCWVFRPVLAPPYLLLTLHLSDRSSNSYLSAISWT
jgi:hypothetical protein